MMEPLSKPKLVPWALLTSAMRFFHDRTDFDRDLIREETKDKEIEDFVAAIDKTHMRFMLRSDLETQLDNLEEKNGQMFNGLANETNERVSLKSLSDWLVSTHSAIFETLI